jgi:hypothetical protein
MKGTDKERERKRIIARVAFRPEIWYNIADRTSDPVN